MPKEEPKVDYVQELAKTLNEMLVGATIGALIAVVIVAGYVLWIITT